jgi:DnaJ-domain-containing protein 1
VTGDGERQDARETSIGVAVVSITTTKRRRFLWCAWWTGAPTREPFRQPDAWSGGARTAEEAKLAAEASAGRTLLLIEPAFARAFTRLRAGLPVWPERRKPEAPAPTLVSGLPPESALAVLGLARGASLDEIKRAYRKRAMETHPDRGGAQAEFVRVQKAYESAVRRAGKRR